MSQEYREKIRKLLSLAQSSNEHEAKAALLKARALMAEHKISEAEVMDAEKNVVTVRINRIFSEKNDGWVAVLANVIGDYHCCKSAFNGSPWSDAITPCFIGFEEDANVCKEIFEYAVDFVIRMGEINRTPLRPGGNDPTRDLIDILLWKNCSGNSVNEFGIGFAEGLKQLYDEQKSAKTGIKEDEEFALVMQIPKEVEDATKGMEERSVSIGVNPSSRNYAAGLEAGRSFQTHAALKGGTSE